MKEIAFPSALSADELTGIAHGGIEMHSVRKNIQHLLSHLYHPGDGAVLPHPVLLDGDHLLQIGPGCFSHAAHLAAA